ncbi:hypothetical protein KO493_09775 [Tamlana agarivorans]|uniref:Uncharacterized protein n=1 Tax=Pseudotamlana agarivorans TaxID=481183 RepID=A0ACC5U9N3_9FLAO|nr:hypothetical protein [Tamlana agarivorans]MBU2950986.1 hypothetical protein [Tamlana agarivorans]
MKRVILGILFLLTITVTFGQSKWDQKKIDYFVDEAVKEFHLDKKQQKELLKERTNYILDYKEVSKKAKAGEITGEEKKTQLNECNNNFVETLKTISGEDNVQPFLLRMRDELKKV